MPKFLYKAKNNPHSIIENVIEADNKNSAIQKVARLGYFLISIEEYSQSEKGAGKRRHIFQKKIKLKDISNFTRQLSDLLESGLTVVRALEVLHKQTENDELKEIILTVRNSCVDGNSLSESLAKHSAYFSNIYISMIRSGEASGALEIVLRRLSDFNDKQLDIRDKVRAALAYPALMSLVGAGTIIILFAWVIPRMMSMFSDLGQNLPLPTLIMVGINEFLQRFWWVVLVILVFAGLSFSKMYKTKEGRMTVDKFKIKMPIFGELIKKIEIAMLARTLASLLSNGVPLLEALKVASDTVNNFVIKDAVIKIASLVKGGSGLTDGFQDNPIFPPIVTSMIAVGEESGQVEKSLFKVAESYDRETDSAIKVMLSLLEPALILVLGIIVGFIVIAMLLPIFEINFLAG